VLTRNDEVLLVRHTYGRRWEWDLPGGGMRRGEEPVRAAAREIEEELGVAPAEWVFLGELFERIGGKHDELWCFSAQVGDSKLSPSPVEIGEVGWFARGALPDGRARYVDRVVALTRTAPPPRR
jgi:8-oxo-dGTP pyrophosphatase MutT (NUDIX family)